MNTCTNVHWKYCWISKASTGLHDIEINTKPYIYNYLVNFDCIATIYFILNLIVSLLQHQHWLTRASIVRTYAHIIVLVKIFSHQKLWKKNFINKLMAQINLMNVQTDVFVTVAHFFKILGRFIICNSDTSHRVLVMLSNHFTVVSADLYYLSWIFMWKKEKVLLLLIWLT